MILTVSLFDKAVHTVDSVGEVHIWSTSLWKEEDCQEVFFVILVTCCLFAIVIWIEVFHMLGGLSLG